MSSASRSAGALPYLVAGAICVKSMRRPAEAVSLQMLQEGGFVLGDTE